MNTREALARLRIFIFWFRSCNQLIEAMNDTIDFYRCSIGSFSESFSLGMTDHVDKMRLLVQMTGMYYMMTSILPSDWEELGGIEPSPKREPICPIEHKSIWHPSWSQMKHAFKLWEAVFSVLIEEKERKEINPNVIEAYKKLLEL